MGGPCTFNSGKAPSVSSIKMSSNSENSESNDEVAMEDTWFRTQGKEAGRIRIRTRSYLDMRRLSCNSLATRHKTTVFTPANYSSTSILPTHSITLSFAANISLV